MGMKAGKESDLVKMLLTWLTHVKRWPAFRLNTGAAKIGNRFVHFGAPGMSDIVAVEAEGEHAGRAWFVEAKAPDGRLRATQRAFADVVLAAGAVYVVVRSLDQLIEYIALETSRAALVEKGVGQ